MKLSRALSFLFVALLVVSTTQLGTIYVNKIVGNLDLITEVQKVTIEQVVFDDDTIFVDFIGELETVGTGGGAGTVIEDTLFKDGSASIPINVDVGEEGTVSGRLVANGGIRADSSFPDFPSFTVDDDTGVTTLLGILFQNDNINLDNGLFFVADTTGETTIQGLTRPDGGISVRTDVFEVIAGTGDVFMSRDFYVGEDIVLGNKQRSNNGIFRVESALPGGDTYIQGQTGSTFGGSLILSPGFGSSSITNDLTGTEELTFNGKILVGRDQPDDITIGRINHVDGGDGGDTILAGQDAGGKGGSLYLESGRGEEGFGDGAIYLIPGGSPAINGDIILGETESFISTSTLRVGRPTLFSGENGSLTSIIGQDTAIADTTGGSLSIFAGNGNLPGHIFLLPGESDNNGDGGNIFIGDETGAALFVTREDVSVQSAGATFYQGQSSFNFDGGDVFIVAGMGGADASTQYPGGDIFLTPGSPNGANTPGAIIWGNAATDLLVSRQDSFTTDGNPLLISGQDATSAGSTGGALTINAGESTNLNGGALYLVGGDGNLVGGEISISGGRTLLAQNAAGGSTTITAGSATGPNGSGGDVIISAGTGTTPGTLFLDGGESATLGFIRIEDVSDFTLEAADFIFLQDTGVPTRFFTVRNQMNSNSVVLSTEEDRFLTATLPGQSIVIRDRFQANNIVYPSSNPSEDFFGYATTITAALNDLYEALSEHHTLVSSVV